MIISTWTIYHLSKGKKTNVLFQFCQFKIDNAVGSNSKGGSVCVWTMDYLGLVFMISPSDKKTRASFFLTGKNPRPVGTYKGVVAL